MAGRFVVVGAGEWFGAPRLEAEDFLVAADGGYPHLLAAGLTPHLVIGDFDSAPPPAGLKTLRLPVVTDDTDMLAALRLGLRAGYTRFALYGGTGGRIDHTLANIQCLHVLAQRGAFSALSLTSRCRGVTIQGMKYTLKDATLSAAFPIGVSNQFTGGPAQVWVRQGVLLAVYPLEAQPQDLSVEGA